MEAKIVVAKIIIIIITANLKVILAMPKLMARMALSCKNGSDHDYMAEITEKAGYHGSRRFIF